MNDPRLDAELRDRFRQLRSEEREAAPDFAALIGRARAALAEGGEEGASARDEGASARPERRLLPAGGRARWLWVGSSVAAAAAIGALLLVNPGSRADREFERTVRTYASVGAGWRTPTDALLDLPGWEITKSVPRVGTPDWSGGAGGAPRRRRS